MDNMPPRPDPFTTSAFPIDGVWLDVELYDSNQMHAYARAYAEQRCAPLVEALQAIADQAVLVNKQYSGIAIDGFRAIARAALATHKEQSNG